MAASVKCLEEVLAGGSGEHGEIVEKGDVAPTKVVGLSVLTSLTDNEGDFQFP